MRQLVDLFSIGCAFKAKALCNGIFASGLSRRKIEQADIGFNPLFRIISARVDSGSRTVTGSLLGGLARRAVFVDGMGAVLVGGASEDDIRSWRPPVPAPPPADPESTHWPAGDLGAAAADTVGLDTERVAKAADRLFVDDGRGRSLRTRAVLVSRQGRLVCERYASAIGRDTRLLSWSMAKSVTSCLAGILVAGGRLPLRDRAPVPEWESASDPRRDITLDQLLRMSSGLEWGEGYSEQPVSDVNRMLFLEQDMAAYAARKTLAAAPDTVWSYSSGTTNIVCGLMRQAFASRDEYWAFPRRAIFDRVGMRSALLSTDSTGTFIGSSYLLATARDYLRFGLLCLADGMWQGERVLPEGWMRYATTPTPAAPKGQYGAFFWLNHGARDYQSNRFFPRLPPDAFFALGYQGQMIAMLPSQGMVVVRLGMTHAADWGLEDFVAEVVAAAGG